MGKVISDDYLAGFADGEGCFYVGIVSAHTARFKWQVITEFRLSQNPQGKVILDAFRKRMGCGSIRPNHRGSPTDKTLAYVVRDQKDLWEKVIPFFEKNPVHSGKSKQFEKFRKVLTLIQEGKHLVKEGFVEILDIAFSMNTPRKGYTREEILSTL